MPTMQYRRRTLPRLRIGTALLLMLLPAAGHDRSGPVRLQAPSPQPLYDLLLSGGTVVDGTGAPAFRGDVAVAGGKIVAVGSGVTGTARQRIEVPGKMVAPGFIDVHTHADNLDRYPLAENFLRMGVTSVVAGNCGSSSVDLEAAFARILEARTSINFSTLVGHNSVRREVMGTDNRPPDAMELSRMKALVAAGLRAGALGFSTGLQYVPGAYAAPDEILELAKVSAASGGIYASHMRNEGTAIEAAIRETVAVGEAARCRVEISHLKIDSPSRWGLAGNVLAMIQAARDRGVDVRADQYVYTAGSSGLAIRFPSWVLEGGEDHIKERLSSEETWTRIRQEMLGMLSERGFRDLAWATVASYPANPALNGRTMKEVAEAWLGNPDPDSQLEAARRMMRQGGASMVYHFMSEDDLVRFLRSPEVAVASDSSLLMPGHGVPHPRGYGNNARVLGRYVRDRRVLSVEEAVRKMTSLPAEHFRLTGRGRLAPGYAADVVVFDPRTVGDTATYESPHRSPAGIETVLVNGVAVILDTRPTGARPGQILKRGAAQLQGEKR